QTQGVEAVRRYFSRLREEANKKSGSKSTRQLVKDPEFIEAMAHVNSLSMDHPKLEAVKEIVEEQFRMKPDSRVIVFTHFRDTSATVTKVLSSVKGVKPIRFIGQSSKEGEKGLTQKQQAEIIEKFKEGVYNVLVATSVAEEGLDIPSTELVVFYEPIPSEIRNIQRRGRTGRKMPGRIVILIAKGTPDEGYYWASRRRERQMQMDLKLLRERLEKNSTPRVDEFREVKQRTLEDFNESKVTIIVDHRENRSSVTRLLSSQGVNLKIEQLPVGDYILSTRIAVERKQVDDYLNSLIQGVLFQQIQKLRDSYSRPFLVIEGEDLFSSGRKINRNAILGSIVAIIVDYGIPVFFTRNPRETADFLFLVARREQEERQKEVALRVKKPSMSLREQQRFIVEGLPNISAVLAERLLEHFGSIRNIINASEEELQEVQGIGPLTASDIYNVVNASFWEVEE
ncbi:MAG TPA: Hef nuclease, partial [Thermoplasmatales archaeon]|nr:Hef nuclease [Thermoplasmatales archaeon]